MGQMGKRNKLIYFLTLIVLLCTSIVILSSSLNNANAMTISEANNIKIKSALTMVKKDEETGTYKWALMFKAEFDKASYDAITNDGKDAVRFGMLIGPSHLLDGVVDYDSAISKTFRAFSHIGTESALDVGVQKVDFGFNPTDESVFNYYAGIVYDEQVLGNHNLKEIANVELAAIPFYSKAGEVVAIMNNVKTCIPKYALAESYVIEQGLGIDNMPIEAVNNYVGNITHNYGEYYICQSTNRLMGTTTENGVLEQINKTIGENSKVYIGAKECPEFSNTSKLDNNFISQLNSKNSNCGFIIYNEDGTIESYSVKVARRVISRFFSNETTSLLNDFFVDATTNRSIFYMSSATSNTYDGLYVLGNNIKAQTQSNQEKAIDSTNLSTGYKCQEGFGFVGVFDGRGKIVNYNKPESGVYPSNGGIFGGMYGATIKNVAFTNIHADAKAPSVFTNCATNCKFENVFIDVISASDCDDSDNYNDGILFQTAPNSSFNNVIVCADFVDYDYYDNVLSNKYTQGSSTNKGAGHQFGGLFTTSDKVFDNVSANNFFSIGSNPTIVTLDMNGYSSTPSLNVYMSVTENPKYYDGTIKDCTQYLENGELSLYSEEQFVGSGYEEKVADAFKYARYYLECKYGKEEVVSQINNGEKIKIHFAQKQGVYDMASMTEFNKYVKANPQVVSAFDTNIWDVNASTGEISWKAIEHQYQAVVTDPTCTQDGYTTYICKDCDDSYVADYMEKLGHDYNQPTYTWNDDYSQVTAERVCLRDGQHVESETVSSVYSIISDSDYESAGLGRYTATFINPIFATQIQEVIIPIKIRPATITDVQGGSIDGTNLFLVINENISTINLSQIIIGTSDTVWELYSDSACQQLVDKTQVDLTFGNNIYYVKAQSLDGLTTRTYLLNVHKVDNVTISYYNGTQLLKTETIKSNSEYTVNCDYAVVGHTIKWLDENGVEKTTFAVLEDINLYASPVINQYSIVFDSNGGTQVPAITQDYNTAVIEPTQPTKAGFRFDGWYEGQTKYAFDKIEPRQVNLTAKWIANTFSITFNSLGGSSVQTITGECGTSIVAPSNPIKEGYSFCGWYRVGSVIAYKFDKIEAKNITLYAKWEINQYSINFDSDGGSEVESIIQDYLTEVSAPANPTRTGYEFIGWFEGDVEYVFNTIESRDVNLIAKWRSVEYTIKFRSNGGSSVNNIVARYGVDIVEPTQPTKQFYNFVGWFEVGSDTAYVFDKMEERDVVLYAKWEVIDELTPFEFKINGSECILVKVKDKTVTSLAIPNNVYSVSADLFKECSELISVQISASVTNIADNAFDKCAKLQTIIVDSQNAYYQSIDGVLYNKGASTLLYYPIASQSSSFAVPNSVEKLADNSIYNCSTLTSITLGSSIKTLGKNTLIECNNLQNISVDGSNNYFASKDGVLYNKNYTILYRYPVAKQQQTFQVQSSVVQIASCAFYKGINLTSVTFSSSSQLTVIGEKAFYGCNNLVTIDLPFMLTTISKQAFINCYSLSSITLRESLETIGEDAFSWCTNLMSVTILESEISLTININSFSYCNKLMEVYMGRTPEFNGSTSSNVTPTLISCSKNVYTSLEVSSKLLNENDFIIYVDGNERILVGYAGIETDLILPEDITSIYQYAFFNNDRITSVTIPAGIKAIKYETFYSCNNLETIIFSGNEMQNIGYQAFAFCNKLKIIEYNGDISSWNDIEKYSYWDDCSGKYIVYCTDGNVEKQ